MVTKAHTFYNDQVAQAPEVNKNFDDLFDALTTVENAYVTTADGSSGSSFKSSFQAEAQAHSLLGNSNQPLGQAPTWDFPIVSADSATTPVFSMSGNNFDWSTHHVHYRGRVYAVTSSTSSAPDGWDTDRAKQVAVYWEVDDLSSPPAAGANIFYKYKLLGEPGSELAELDEPMTGNSQRFYLAMKTGGGLHLPFTSGSEMPSVGDVISGQTSNTEAEVLRITDMTDNDWQGGTAAGKIYYTVNTGPGFSNSEIIDNDTSGTNDVMTSGSGTEAVTADGFSISTFNTPQLFHGGNIFAGSIDAEDTIKAETIKGHHIATESIETTHLDFTAVTDGTVIASINASDEAPGVTITADRLLLNGEGGVFASALNVTNTITLGDSGNITSTGKTDIKDSNDGIFLGYSATDEDYAFEVHGNDLDGNEGYLRYSAADNELVIGGVMIDTPQLQSNATSHIHRFTDNGSAVSLPYIRVLNGDSDDESELAPGDIVEDVELEGTGVVDSTYKIGGTWSGGSWAGYIAFSKIEGNFGKKNSSFRSPPESHPGDVNFTMTSLNNTQYFGHDLSAVEDYEQRVGQVTGGAEKLVGVQWDNASRSSFTFTPSNTGTATVTVRFQWRHDNDLNQWQSFKVINIADSSYSVWFSGREKMIAGGWGDGQSEQKEYSFEISTTANTEIQLQLYASHDAGKPVSCGSIIWECDEHYK